MDNNQNNNNYTDYNTAAGTTPPAEAGASAPMQNEYATANPGTVQVQYVSAPAPAPEAEIETEPPMRIRDWLLLLLLLSIPCVGFILLFVWGFSDTPGKKSRANFCKAYLIWYAIGIALAVLLYVIMFAIIFAMGMSMSEVAREFEDAYYAARFLF